MVKVEAINDAENPRYRVTASVAIPEAEAMFRRCMLFGYFLRTENLMVIIPKSETSSTGFARFITMLADREAK